MPVLAYHGIGDSARRLLVTQRGSPSRSRCSTQLGYDDDLDRASTAASAPATRDEPAGQADPADVRRRPSGLLPRRRPHPRSATACAPRCSSSPARSSAGNPFYLTWDELHAMRDSGRWDIQPHAARRPQRVATDAQGDRRPVLRGPALHDLGRPGDRSRTGRRASPRTCSRAEQRFADHGIHAAGLRRPVRRLRPARDERPEASRGCCRALLTRQFGSLFIQADEQRPELHPPGHRRRPALRAAHGRASRPASTAGFAGIRTRRQGGRHHVRNRGLHGPRPAEPLLLDGLTARVPRL